MSSSVLIYMNEIPKKLCAGEAEDRYLGPWLGKGASQQPKALSIMILAHITPE